MIYKIILAGRLEFGNEKSFQKVFQMYQFRVENFYKTDLLLKEDAFDPENFYLNIPRLVTQSEERKWDNTVKLLDYLAQFAIAGSIMMWLIDETGGKKRIEHHIVEPQTDKAAVQEYLKGRTLIDESGKEVEAIEALNRAIEKYERHALAYERRGYVNFQLRNLNDALYDFTKSIDLNPNNPEPFFGRALVKVAKNDWAGALEDLDTVVQNSIPLQPIYWKARRIKGECYLKTGEFANAIKEYKLYTVRAFESSDPNFQWCRYAFFNYGKALMETSNFAEAQRVFDQAKSCLPGKGNITDDEILIFRGLAARHAGKAGFRKDWEDALEMGSKRAAELLAEVD